MDLLAAKLTTLIAEIDSLFPDISSFPNLEKNLQSLRDDCVRVSEQEILPAQAMQRALAEKEERLKLATEAGNVGIWDWLISENKLVWNVQMHLLFDHPEENFTGTYEDFIERLYPGDVDRVNQEVQEAIETRTPFTSEYRVIDRKGALHYIHAKAKLHEDKDGTLTRMTGVCIDVTKERLATTKLQASEERFRSLYSRTPTMLYSIDREGHIISVSDCWLENLGYSRDEVLGHPLLEFLAPASRPYAERELLNKKFFRMGRCKDLSYQFLKKDGTIMDVLLSAITEFDDEGNVERSLAAITDVTDRKHLERELYQQREQLRLIFDNVPARIWFKDDKNKVLRANRPAAESMGMSVEETENTDTYELFPEMAEKYYQDDLEVIKSGQPKLGIIERYTPKGQKASWVRTDKIPYIDVRTGKRYVLVLAQDITEQMQLQEEVKQTHDHLVFCLESIGAGFWDWDMRTGIVKFSQSWAQELGYGPDDTSSDINFWEGIIHPDDLKASRGRLEKHFRGEIDFYEYHNRLRMKSGEYRSNLERGFVVERDEDGKPLRMVGVDIDLTKFL